MLFTFFKRQPSAKGSWRATDGGCTGFRGSALISEHTPQASLASLEAKAVAFIPFS